MPSKCHCHTSDTKNHDSSAAPLKNHIKPTGHDTTLPTDGHVNDALIACHEARARGGAGLIVMQVAGVHETTRYTSHTKTRRSPS
ncbi:hypothetical protein ACFSHT_03395 [Paraburkholderia silviterrae]|uniref:Uncharacterized protein n=2 Tax=Paraburkholderia silviterrae TaxID=2528715 RepID=A0A4R5M588_9BURK|nr:hypothetical protein EYW47_23945 [Paraburkholderia silviterrae]